MLQLIRIVTVLILYNIYPLLSPGQDMVHDGLGPCLVGGFITASAILNRNLLQDAEKLEKELKSTSRKKKQ